MPAILAALFDSSSETNQRLLSRGRATPLTSKE
jgi:hypothetical protein